MSQRTSRTLVEAGLVFFIGQPTEPPRQKGPAMMNSNTVKQTAQLYRSQAFSHHLRSFPSPVKVNFPISSKITVYYDNTRIII